jgi:hypothetical protein
LRANSFSNAEESFTATWGTGYITYNPRLKDRAGERKKEKNSYEQVFVNAAPASFPGPASKRCNLFFIHNLPHLL